jgi:hypothetical protein
VEDPAKQRGSLHRAVLKVGGQIRLPPLMRTQIGNRLRDTHIIGATISYW